MRRKIIIGIILLILIAGAGIFLSTPYNSIEARGQSPLQGVSKPIEVPPLTLEQSMAVECKNLARIESKPYVFMKGKLIQSKILPIPVDCFSSISKCPSRDETDAFYITRFEDGNQNYGVSFSGKWKKLEDSKLQLNRDYGFCAYPKAENVPGYNANIKSVKLMEK